MFNVKVFQPHYGKCDGDESIDFRKISNIVVDASSIKEAVQIVTEPLPQIEGAARKLLEETDSRFPKGKKGYIVLVAEMLCKATKLWEIPSEEEATRLQV